MTKLDREIQESLYDARRNKSNLRKSGVMTSVTGLKLLDWFREQTPERQAELKPQLRQLFSQHQVSVQPHKKPLKLLPFQVDGIKFLNKLNGNALLADEMGLGKTIQALGYLAVHPDQRPALIVCPASLKLNWGREALKWLPASEKISIAGKELEKSGVIIINYDLLKKHAEALMALKAQVLILDESHYVKNQKAQRTQQVVALSQSIPHKILLSGTPILNRPCELHQQLNIINPQEYGSFYSFINKTNKELHSKLQTIMIRRRKLDVIKQLPDKRRALMYLDIDNKSEYIKAENNVIAFVRRTLGNEKAKSALRAEGLVRIEVLKQIAVKGKMKAVIDWIHDFLECDEKLVVFATHHTTIDALYEEFKDIAVKLTGDMAQGARQASVDAFQTNPAIKLFIGNTQAAGVGITLTAASNAAIIELGWNPGVMVQAEDRIHRIGQKNAATVYYLLAKNTIDETIAKLLESKAQAIDAVMDGAKVPEFDIFNNLLDHLTSSCARRL